MTASTQTPARKTTTKTAAVKVPTQRPKPPARRQVAGLVPVTRIIRNERQPRQLFDQAALDELALSMLAIGQIQPVSVQYDPSTRLYTLIAGERRWRAARLTADPAWRTIHNVDRPPVAELSVLIEYGLEDADILPRAVAENLGRRDMTPMEEARAFHRLETDHGYSRDEVAVMSGKTVEYVGYRIDLLSLVGAASEALDKGHLPVGTAWYVGKLSPAGQQTFMRKWVAGQFPTARDAEAFAQAVRSREENVQDDLFAVAAISDEQRAKIDATRHRVTSRVDQLAKAGEILADLAATDPAELAAALATLPGGVDGYRQRVAHLHTAAGKAAATLRKATGIAAAATVETPALATNPTLI